jgi:sugar-specific transcriptional regulator TrmB
MKNEAQNKIIQTLTRLGLNCSQAKVYLALVQNGELNAKEISHFSRVNRQEIYRIIPKLQKLCLVEKILTSPTMWKPTPMKLGLKLLMERRNKETCELLKESKKIGNSLTKKDEKLKAYMDHSFIMIEGEKKIGHYITKGLENTQVSGDVLSYVKDTITKFHYLEKSFLKMLKQGAQMRMILYVSEEEKMLINNNLKIMQFPNFHVKYIFGVPRAVFFIRDKNEVIISTSPVNPDSYPALVSNSTVLVGILQDYFELLWESID